MVNLLRGLKRCHATTLFGVSIVTLYWQQKNDNHIRITFHLSKLSEKTKKIIISFADVIWLMFNLVVVYVSIKYVMSMFEYPYYSQTLRFNLVYVYMIVPVGFFFLFRTCFTDDD